MVMTGFPEWPQDDYDFSAAEVGQAMAGLVVRDAAGFPVEGMLAEVPAAAVPGAWKVEVGRFVYVRNVLGSARFSGLSGAEQVDVTNAAALTSGQSRIDRIAWNPIISELVYVQGVPGASPAVPSIGGNAPVLRVLVQAGDGMVVAARVTSDAVLVGLAREQRPIATSTIVHYLGVSNVSTIIVATGLTPVDYPRVLSVSNGDLGANHARFEAVTQVLAPGATNAAIGWTGAGVGSARVNFTAIPVEP